MSYGILDDFSFPQDGQSSGKQAFVGGSLYSLTEDHTKPFFEAH